MAKNSKTSFNKEKNFLNFLPNQEIAQELNIDEVRKIIKENKQGQENKDIFLYHKDL